MDFDKQKLEMLAEYRDLEKKREQAQMFINQCMARMAQLNVKLDTLFELESQEKKPDKKEE